MAAIDEKTPANGRNSDPTFNVRELISLEVDRINDLRKVEVRRIDEKIDASNDKYQIQFADSKEAVNTAFIAQEKAIAAALAGTKEAINKSDTTTDKRFDLLSEKIDGIGETLSKSAGAQGIYVTQPDLTMALDKLQNNIEVTLRPVVAFMNSQTGRAESAATNWTQVGIVGGIIIALLKVFKVL